MSQRTLTAGTYARTLHTLSMFGEKFCPYEIEMKTRVENSMDSGRAFDIPVDDSHFVVEICVLQLQIE